MTISCWDTPEAGYSKAQLERIPGFLLWLGTSKLLLARKLRTFALGTDKLQCTVSEMKALETSVLDKRDSLSAAERDLQILGKAVAWLNQTGIAELPQPKLARLFQFPKTPFIDGFCGALERTQALIDCEADWIRESSRLPPVELIVLSAILHGGLWHKSSIVHFARCLFAPEKAFQDAGSRVICKLDLPWRGKPEMEKRVWQLDDHTAALLRPVDEYANASQYRVRDTDAMAAWTDKQLVVHIVKRIRARMRKSGMKRELIPESLKQMLDAISLAARTELPCVLVDYAERSLVSHSLKPEALARMFSISCSQSEASANDTSDDKVNAEVSALLDLDRNLNSTQSSPEEIEPEELRALRKALRTEDRKIAAQQLALLPRKYPANGNDTWPIIVSFAVYLIEERHNHRRSNIARRRLAVSTVRAYAMTIGRRLGQMLGSTRLLDLDVRAIEDLYIEILENAYESSNPQRLRRAVTLALREFHEYLVRKHNAPAINEAAVLGVSHGLMPVNANIVLLDEYIRARNIIRWDLHIEYSELERTIAEAMLILGFRCGTHRMESYGLQIADLLDGRNAWLFIRPNEQRGLKTPNAQRQLPLFALMQGDELAVLSRFKRQDGRLRPATECLFASGQKAVSVDRIMEIVHEGLRRATGDDRMHFHHLRHSFATWTFLRLMLSDLDAIPEIFRERTLTNAWLHESKAFRRALYGHGNPTRKHTMAVASLLGHSGPSISCEHYIHSMDWLLPLFLGKSLIFSPPNAQFVTASNLPSSTVYAWQQILGRSPEIRRNA
jgi:site-specific recombinase XerD